jgi:S-adenosylhomocysteine hydrolase
LKPGHGGTVYISQVLGAMGVRIDKLTPNQREYLQSWQEGT